MAEMRYNVMSASVSQEEKGCIQLTWIPIE